MVNFEDQIDTYILIGQPKLARGMHGGLTTLGGLKFFYTVGTSNSELFSFSSMSPHKYAQDSLALAPE